MAFCMRFEVRRLSRIINAGGVGKRSSTTPTPNYPARSDLPRSHALSDRKVIVMIDHTGIGVADVTRSAVFYDAALGALGFRRVIQLPEGDGSDGIGYGVDYRCSGSIAFTRMA
jgi:hypothetical protein